MSAERVELIDVVVAICRIPFYSLIKCTFFLWLSLPQFEVSPLSLAPCHALAVLTENRLLSRRARPTSTTNSSPRSLQSMNTISIPSSLVFKAEPDQE